MKEFIEFIKCLWKGFPDNDPKTEENAAWHFPQDQSSSVHGGGNTRRFMEKLNQTPTIVKLFIALLTIITLSYLWVLTSAKLELGGSRPNQQVLGKASWFDAQQMQQGHRNGVLATPQGVWLVSYHKEMNLNEVPKEALNLETLLPEQSEDEQLVRQLSHLVGRRALSPYGWEDLAPGGKKQGVSLIARLGEDGMFHVLAFVRGDASLVASPDGTPLFLLTKIDLPYEGGYPNRVAVFRTDDQGKTWQLLLKEGFMAKANPNPILSDFYFYNNDEVWSWEFYRTTPERFFYSPDQGVHVEPIEDLEELWVDERPLPQRDYSHEIKVNLVQLNARQAKIWVSQSYWWNWNGGSRVFTREAQLTREEGIWRRGEIRTTTGLFIKQVKDNGAGRIFAEVHKDYNSELVELSADGSAWEKRNMMPNLFWPFPTTQSGTLNSRNTFFVSGDVMLAKIYSVHDVLRSSIYADAVYYSNNSGSSWTKLTIPGAIAGFNAQKKLVYWSKKSWDRDPNIYSYDLSR